MKLEELMLGDIIIAPFYGDMVPVKVVGLKDYIMYEPLDPGPHKKGPYLSRGDNVVPFTLWAATFAKNGWKVTTKPKVMATLYAGRPVPVYLRWYEENKALIIGKSLFPTPICNLHQLQHILSLLNIDFNI